MKIQVTEKEMKFENSTIFDRNSAQWSNDQEYNLMFIKAMQNHFNDLLRVRGHVFLNEIFDALGLPRTNQGVIIGWIYGEMSNNFIDLQTETLSDEQIKLTFNVDGVIWDLI